MDLLQSWASGGRCGGLLLQLLQRREIVAQGKTSQPGLSALGARTGSGVAEGWGMGRAGGQQRPWYCSPRTNPVLSDFSHSWRAPPH